MTVFVVVMRNTADVKVFAKKQTQKHSRKNIITGMMVVATSERQKFNKKNKKGG